MDEDEDQQESKPHDQTPAQQVENQMVSVPFGLITKLLLNNRKTFDYNDLDPYLKGSTQVDYTTAGLLKLFDPEGLVVHVQFPEDPDVLRRIDKPIVWNARDWQHSYERTRYLKLQSDATRAMLDLRNEKIVELAFQLVDQVEFSIEAALEWSILNVMKRHTKACAIYGVDISALSDEVTSKCEILPTIDHLYAMLVKKMKET